MYHRVRQHATINCVVNKLLPTFDENSPQFDIVDVTLNPLSPRMTHPVGFGLRVSVTETPVRATIVIDARAGGNDGNRRAHPD